MINTEASTDSTLMDDSVAEVGRTEEQLLADIVRNSDFVEPLPNEQVPELDPEESETEDPDVSEEAVSEEVEEESEEEVVEETDEDAAEAATQESDIYAIEDLDMDAKVVIKIDGEETEVPFSDLIKGYSTEQHLSKKGRELGDARKGLEEEFQTKMGQVEQLSQASIAVLYSSEQSHSKAYHDIEGQIEEARKSDDTYAVNELKDKREIIQKEYWQARNQREQLVQSVTEQTKEQKNKMWNDQLKIFNDTIPDLIPGFNADIAKDIREFAIKEGIPAEVLDTIADPIIVKFVDDYRKLKQGISKGTAKRKLTTSSKAPLRKNSPATKKKKDAAALLRSKTLSGKASESEQKDFLRGLAQRSLNL
tara:strand:+ start:649 stop:1743 length:1095 start_codon:yes stop_codon:yes gene_type:complete